MIPADAVRRKAWAIRQELDLSPDTLVPAEQLIAAMEAHTDVYRQLVPAGDPLLGGAQAVLNIGESFILQNDDLPAQTKLYDATHEFGHWFLHQNWDDSADCECSSDDLGAFEDDLDSLPISKVIGYSSHERKESEANVFAAELLLPLQLAHKLFSEYKWSAARIAEELGVSEGVAKRQLTDAVLLPLPKAAEPAVPTVPSPLDDSQKAAAEAMPGPLLVSAGPGTGKTKTLVGRCLYLIDVLKVRPQSIAALTYSRKAADEMLERLQLAGVGSESSGPNVGTFHSFGNEILRKYGDRIGLDPHFQLIDDMDANALLENNLASLNLVDLKSIRNPSQYLSGVIKQIGKAKSELCSPDDYAVLANRAHTIALQKLEEFQLSDRKKTKKDTNAVEDEFRKAKRMLEVARCYTLYEELTAAQNLVDYSDLINKSVFLLQNHPDVRERIHRTYPHILADEYQDVNRASSQLLKLLVSESAAGLWVVGDHRQSIYQFQGASPANVSRFLNDYPNGKLHQLLVNYRSVDQIVQTFAKAASQLSFTKIGQSEPHWSAYRGSSSSKNAAVLANVNNKWDQCEFIKERIVELQKDGVPLSQMAVLCRKHAQAKEAADSLMHLGIPSLYLGRILERPEVKSLVSIIAAVTGDSAAYAAALEMPEYASDNENASEKLSQHVDLLRPYIDRPDALLRAYIFEHSRFLEMLDVPVSGGFLLTQKKLAVHRFISIVEAFDRRAVTLIDESESSRSIKLLGYLRRLTSFGSTTDIPDGFETVEAVRVMTLHSAKGLEFPVVFLPNLNKGMFPGGSPHDGVPEVPGLGSEGDGDADEEECLFFVGLSRARDHLFVTYYNHKDSGAPVEPSPLLSSLTTALSAGNLTHVDLSHVNDQATKSADNSAQVPANGVKPIFTASELDKYLRCPRSYYYSKIACFKGTSADESFLKYRNVVTQLTDWIEEQASNGNSPSSDERSARLTEIWQTSGLAGHLHEPMYLAEATKIALIEPIAAVGKPSNVTLTAKLSNALVHVRPDKAVFEEQTATLTRRIIGGGSDSEHTDKRLALYRRAVADTYPELVPIVNLHYLDDGRIVDVPESAKLEPNRLAKYENAVEGILAERFPAHPSTFDGCKTCEFLFACDKSDLDDGD